MEIIIFPLLSVQYFFVGAGLFTGVAANIDTKKTFLTFLVSFIPFVFYL